MHLIAGIVLAVLMLLKQESRPWAIFALIFQLVGLIFPFAWEIGIILDFAALFVFIKSFFRS